MSKNRKSYSQSMKDYEQMTDEELLANPPQKYKSIQQLLAENPQKLDFLKPFALLEAVEQRECIKDQDLN